MSRRPPEKIDCHRALEIARSFYDCLLLDEPMEADDPVVRIEVDIHAHYHQNHPLCSRAISAAREASCQRVVANGKYADLEEVDHAMWSLEVNLMGNVLREELGGEAVDRMNEIHEAPEVVSLAEIQAAGEDPEAFMLSMVDVLSQHTTRMNDEQCVDLYGELPPPPEAFV